MLSRLLAFVAFVAVADAVMRCAPGKLSTYEHVRSLENCTTLDVIWIEGCADCIDISPLKLVSTVDNVTSLNASVIIKDNPILTSLFGLESLAGSLKGGITIESNSKLVSTDGLGGIKAAKFLFVKSNTLLKTLKLGNLTSLHGMDSDGRSMYIYGSAFVDLAGLSSLAGCLHGGITIYSNTALLTLAGLESVSGASYLYLRKNSRIASLAGLNGLKYLHGKYLHGSTGISLYVRDNDALTSIEGLGLQGRVEGGIYIYSNGKLETLAGINGVTAAAWIYMRYEKKLVSLAGLGNLSVLHGEYISTSCPAGSFCLRDNDALTSVNGLEALRELEGGIYIHSNGVRAGGMESVAMDSVTTAKYLTVGSEMNLISVSLKNLTILSGKDSGDRSIYFASNNDLVTIRLPALRELAGGIYMYCAKMQSLALDSVTTALFISFYANRLLKVGGLQKCPC
jgi:hypothetical protein